MLLKPFLKLNQLQIIRNGKIVYDEFFREGVNIIRGSNSSGKSTIADFIFFALGGDIHKWKPEAEICDYVVAEVLINDAPITIRRDIQNSSRQPMWIYWGPILKSKENSIEGWEVYPFQRSAKKESFSQVLFRIIGLPEVRGDSDSNITMHQILRLLYIDQMSPVDSLMRVEQFDTQLTRKTIGDLILGIYDDSLYANELDLREKQKELESIKKQHQSVREVLSEAGQEIELSVILKSISETEEQIAKLRGAIEKYNNIEKQHLDSEDLSSIKKLQNEFQAAKFDLSKKENELERLDFAIEDSNQFIINLENRLKSIDNSIITREALGQLELSYCPNCLKSLPKPESENICFLCSQELTQSVEKSQIARMKQELAHQIKESKYLTSKNQQSSERLRRNRAHFKKVGLLIAQES